MVLKPAPQTPLCSLLLAECVQQAGWPDGGLNVLPLSNEDAGLLVTDDRIKLISFTGSVPVGWDIKRRAGKKKVVLELGGNAAVIVHSDADLAYAAERCVTGGFGYAGQTCISVQRILVEHSVYGKLHRSLRRRRQEIKDRRSARRIHRRRPAHPRERCDPHHRLDRRGRPCRRPPALRRRAQELWSSSPTVLTGTKPDMKVNCQEIFGPVVTVEPYKDFDEALRQVNNSAYRPAGRSLHPRREAALPGLRRTRSRRRHRRRRPFLPHRSHALRRRQRFRPRPRRPALRDRRNDRTQTDGDEPALTASRSSGRIRPERCSSPTAGVIPTGCHSEARLHRARNPLFHFAISSSVVILSVAVFQAKRRISL